MSETTTETTTEAAKETAENAEQQTQGDPAEQLGEGGKKALTAEREARKAAEDAAKALQKQLDEINAANMSDLERAQKEAADAKEAAAKATAEALRYRVATRHGITDEDAELFLTGSDEDTLERQAARLVERTPATPKPDPSQGSKGEARKTTTADVFAEWADDNFQTL